MKTKVIETLEKSQFPYKLHDHSKFLKKIESPLDFANQLGYDISRITKSLFVRSNARDTYAIVVCSMNLKVDFKVLAKIMGCKKVEVANLSELQKKVGYPSKGVSPIGIINVPTYLDSGLKDMPTILLGAGEVGFEVEITPSILQLVTKADFYNFTKEH